MRLIDADALLAEAMADGAYGYVDAKQIADAPTIDAVPVVRCRDCVCGEERVDKNRLTYWFCTFAQHPTSKHNYCVWGERKDDVQII